MTAPPTARVTSVRFDVSVHEHEDTRDLTEQELASVAFAGPRIALRSEGGVVEHEAPNGKDFTVRDLVRAIEETERRTRDQTERLGGVDIHHVFFEGLGENGNGTWTIRWGS